MTIAWDSFTPLAALAGGLLLGLGSALFILGSGRIAGISGIVASPLRALLGGARLRPERSQLHFLAGLLAAPRLWQLFAPLPASTLDVGADGLLLAGLLVGAGTRMANGCTSGHGVCGLSRLSLRSAVNVAVFMATGVATVFVLRHLFGGP